MSTRWNDIFSQNRIGVVSTSMEARTEYQRDFDRIIFSSGFRRLQNKTQVFPLPGSTFVHNRLTHSLEVSSVGRSLGKMVGEEISRFSGLSGEAGEFYKYDLQNVVATACLAHDIGNPAFGHSGEKAISNYFNQNKTTLVDGRQLGAFFEKRQWADFSNFEGNANALRVLTHHFRGKNPMGYGLTMTTLASLLKYPCGSLSVDKSRIHRKKYGFFQSEEEAARSICTTLNMVQEPGESPVYKRHPFVYLTEAADDICYRILDLEDAQRLGIISNGRAVQYLLTLIEAVDRKEDDMDRINKTCGSIEDGNEQIAYLRAKCINTLTLESAERFIENSGAIIEGTYNDALVDSIQKSCPPLKQIEEASVKEIYNHDTVVEIELAGYHVMSDLLSLFVPAVLTENPHHKDEKVRGLIPSQFKASGDSYYDRVLSVLDYISGMTDPYATELYRKVYGIDIPRHR